MELVLSPGRLGGDNNTGSPFQNQEVREWSHVDRLTGMLEHARVETGRWQTRHQGTAQAYGKVIDSRERNSADGNVVQKARRQVEVFQSQGIGGRSVQVVRASQWSSSRITDSTSSSPVSVSTNDVAQIRNGNDESVKSVNGRLQCSADESLTKLSQVSRLCRQINGEATAVHSTRRLQQTNSPTIISSKSRAQSPPTIICNRLKKFNGAINIGGEERNDINNRLASSSLVMNSLKSTSNEDLTNSNIESNTKSANATFTRDCKARRSLQIPKSTFTGNRNVEIRSEPEGVEFNSSRNSPSTDHDHSKSDGKRVKSYVLGMEEADSDSLGMPKTITEKKILFNGAVVDEIGRENLIKSEYLRPTPILPKTKSNTTVVHLNNKLFLDSLKNNPPEDEPISSSENDAVVRTTSRVQSLASRFSNGNGFKSIGGIKSETNSFASSLTKKSVIDSSSRIDGLIGRSAGINTAGENTIEDKNDQASIGNSQLAGRPVKKVGFCKTEVHFAAESGKVNIVETDAKPPPSNRFRRRRRGSAAIIGGVPIAAQNKNLPLIHFGDTSYEKYIFGSLRSENLKGKTETTGSDDPEDADFLPIKDKTELHRSAIEPFVRDGWRARLKTIMQSEPPMIADAEIDDNLNSGDNFDPITDETTIVDHSFKGSHTTTVNLGANVLSKLQKHAANEGKCNTISTGIQPQFNNRLQKLQPNSDIKTSAVDITKNDHQARSVIVTANKNSIVVSTVSKIPRPLIQTHQSVLKSAHLVMNLNRINKLGKNYSFLNKCERNDNDSLTLEHLISSLKGNCKGMVMRGEESEADIVNNNTSTVITVNAKNASMNRNNNLITNSKTYSSSKLFTPLRLKHSNDPSIQCDEKVHKVRRIEDANDIPENNQMQYSSGSEQADEEVRSYMLGSKIQQSYTQHAKFSNSRSIIATEESTRTIYKSKEQESNSIAVNETSKDRSDQFIDNIEQKHTIDKELDDIVDSGLPVEEICFEANRTVEKNHVVDKLTNESNVVTSDNENNKVLLNIVTTHEPIIARVEDGHNSPVENRRELFAGKKMRNNSAINDNIESEEELEKIARASHRGGNKSLSSNAARKSIVKQKAKDHCDRKIGKKLLPSGSIDDGTITVDPTYVNVFENGKKSAPIYENYRVTRKKKHCSDIKKPPEVETVMDVVQKSTNGNCESETSLSNFTADDCEEENFKKYSKSRESAELTSISESNSSKKNSSNESQKMKPIKTRSKKIHRPPSPTSSIESIHRNSANEGAGKDSESRPLHTKSTRSSRLHRVTSGHESSARESGGKYSSNDKKKKNITERTSSTQVPRSNHPVETIAPTKNDVGSKNLNDSTRSKKPIEIVYQTAVFNMKNEKLSKSSRSKESKTPRYINDLICGGRPKRSTDVRHVKGTTQSQQRVHHKSASPTNRHWK